MDAATVTAETRPLLGTDAGPPPQENWSNSDTTTDECADFDLTHDPDNPLAWKPAFKWTIVALLASMAFTVTFTCASVVPVASRIVRDLNGDNDSSSPAAKSASILLVTIWELGEAGGPLLIAPLSEVVGRAPVIHAANLLFVVASALAALSPSVPFLIAARALNGFAVASNVLAPAIVGDMFVSERRGTAMSAIGLAPLIGGAMGPAICGAVAQGLGWRAVMWISAALAGVCEVLFLVFFKETYKVAILKRKAAKAAKAAKTAAAGELRGGEEQGLPAIVVPASDRHEWRKLWESVMRPVVVLAGSGVLMTLSLFGSVVFAYFYIVVVTLPDVLETLYGFSPAVMGSSMLFFSIGSVISVIICNLFLDKIYVRLRETHKGPGQPEYRLPLVIVGAFTLPFAVASFGWTAQLRLPLPLLLFSVSLMGLAFVLAFLPLLAYVVDAFGLYSASAATGVIVTRCLMGTFLPLATGPLIRNYGYGWGLSILAVPSLILAPIPVLIIRYGAQWRQRSRYTKDE